MGNRVECVLGADLLPWERQYFAALLPALQTRFPIAIHSPTLAPGVDPQSPVWILARDARAALMEMPRGHRGPVWTSVLAVQSRRRFFGIFPRAWNPRGDLKVGLLTHSPFATRFHRELERVPEAHVAPVALPGLLEPVRPSASGLRVGFATALNSDANLNFLVSVAHYVAQVDSHIRFHVPFEGPLAGHLQRMISDLKLESSFEPFGEGEDVNALLFSPLKADQFLPVLWAAARGIPVLSTDVPGIEQVLSDGHDGFVIPVNEAKPVGELLVRLGQDTRLRESLGERLRQGVAKRFPLDRALDGLAGRFQASSAASRARVAA